MEHASATLAEASAAVVVLDPELRAAWTGARLCGPAFTVQGESGDNLALHRAILQAPVGHVIVADVGGGTFGHWGEVLTVAALHRGIAGLLIDGGVRDKTALNELAFPVFSRNDTITGTRKRFPGVLGRSISLAGAQIHTGDYVVGDADGCVVIPAAALGDTLARADERVRREEKILGQIRRGQTTMELYGLPVSDAADTNVL
ncbi:RraA family protein [Curtobacterium flaccumfaciens pv. oortii]|uniref:RraA family protein n=1 Tax=Curtobacterium flaccumfaciens TaxID=2035 RepID=UPI002658D8A8|nr:RraA family protein [Curtobacterium flaccumfaciens]MCS5524644.1 RraA family protein [Curtobacterium flaccumfaciens pv. oortii]